ncbi:hypothetical protein KC352_g19051 [Hortaea werneckii]|nr:hypothetical protein KC352_g19051 [Hortaea werneckii]
MDTDSSTNITTNPSHQSNSSTELVGWQDESSGRGSLSIVLSCLYTTAICTWVVIHARIDRREKFRVAHKLALCFKTFLAPEFIAVEAAQEWTQAQRTVRDAVKYTDSGMRLLQAYYIGMFGIRYRTDEGTKVLWPNQFLWLLEQGHLEWGHHPEWGLSEEVIKDKSNADSAAKLFALAQSVWFVARCATRAFHHFPISPLESMTLGYIPLFMIAYLFWWVKPKDIELPSIIDLPVLSESQQEQFENLAVDDSFDEEGKASQASLWSAWQGKKSTQLKLSYGKTTAISVCFSTARTADSANLNGQVREKKSSSHTGTPSSIIPDYGRSHASPVFLSLHFT